MTTWITGWEAADRHDSPGVGESRVEAVEVVHWEDEDRQHRSLIGLGEHWPRASRALHGFPGATDASAEAHSEQRYRDLIALGDAHALMLRPVESPDPPPMKIVMEEGLEPRAVWYPYWRDGSGAYYLVPEGFARRQAVVDAARKLALDHPGRRLQSRRMSASTPGATPWTPDLNRAWTFGVSNRPRVILVPDQEGREHEVELRPQQLDVLRLLHDRLFTSWTLNDLANAAGIDTRRLEDVISKVRQRLRSAHVSADWTKSQIVHGDGTYGMGVRLQTS